ncbi:uncharacterized protein LOC116117210 [Pistacia vera]|uniref:uncharacterized protein LOC116114414 n=1 Tax=Pistacia vera TaxID=55513 RepID=UPI001262B632|nr:uncharacterized protein LOC116114414 [Pistacia vera]XP_031259104.1 uncharacterized protein LOC116117210 [Pistacia vera]
MVVWEITLATAYFLGLKRTYRLALKIQRRIISQKHPKIRQFAHRRTRAVFDVALKFHRKIQERDIEVGRNLGNWILRWLDRMKPSAQIRGSSEKPIHGSGPNMNMSNQVTQSSKPKTNGISTSRNQDSDRHLFTSLTNIRPKHFPSIAMMLRPPRTAGSITQCRHLYNSGADMSRLNYKRGGFDGVIRKDIMLWMLQN